MNYVLQSIDLPVKAEETESAASAPETATPEATAPEVPSTVATTPENNAPEANATEPPSTVAATTESNPPEANATETPSAVAATPEGNPPEANATETPSTVAATPEGNSPEANAPEATEVDFLAGVRPPLAAALRERGFSDLTAVQKAILAANSHGHDLRISSQTGSGKTVAIGLAMAETLCGPPSATPRRGGMPRVLVLVPTRELAVQVRDELNWLYARVSGVRVEVVMGGTSLTAERRTLSRCPDVVVGTPGRVLDHLRTGALQGGAIEHVALDEADRMLEMGFREELEAIMESMPEQYGAHLVSATFPKPVQRLADRFQAQPLHIQGTRLGEANGDIAHIAHVVNAKDTYPALANLLLLDDSARYLIFVERRIDASGLAERLATDGFNVQALSGELAQSQRTRTLNAFRNGSVRVLVSTDVAARGIDVPDIEFVIHFDPPKDGDSYVHRSGRTGRAGRTGSSVMLVPPRSKRKIERLARQAKVEVEWQPPPSAKKVRKRRKKRFRQGLHETLAASEEFEPKQIDYAKTLLEDHDPASLVATLLEMATPAPVREPMDVHEASEVSPAGPSSDFVRFSINWGTRNGAATNRLLGHICRRGDIRGNQVGAIEMGADSSTFDVDQSVAKRFEQRVSRPDPRDPKVRIQRLEGSHPARGRGRNTGHPKRQYRGSGKPGGNKHGKRTQRPSSRKPGSAQH